MLTCASALAHAMPRHVRSGSRVRARAAQGHPAFELLRVEMVDEYTIKCATYRHTKSGAEVISAQADDDKRTQRDRVCGGGLTSRITL